MSGPVEVLAVMDATDRMLANDGFNMKARGPLKDARAAIAELIAAQKATRRELHACQAVIHLAGGFDPAYVTGAQAAIKQADAALAAIGHTP